MLVKLEWFTYHVVKKNSDHMLSRFHLIPERHVQTGWWTDRQTDLLYRYLASVCWRAIIKTKETNNWIFMCKLPLLFVIFIARQQTDARYWYSNYVRPSVRPSVCPSFCLSVSDVPVLDENGLTYCHNFSPHGSPITAVLSASNILAKFWRGHTLRGAKYR